MSENHKCQTSPCFHESHFDLPIDTRAKCPNGHNMLLCYVHFDAIKSKCPQCGKYFAYNQQNPKQSMHIVNREYFENEEKIRVSASDKLAMLDELDQHSLFIDACKEYIRECANNGTSPETVLNSFKLIIDEVIEEMKK